jgi:2-polyprenyl-3-methyl-5-hydroxy-6-metoxy-1,4-benzoquinol methylase
MLERRSGLKEIMDGEADLEKLHRTVRQFRILNLLFSSSVRLIAENFFEIMKKDPSAEYTMLDIGAGGCDIDIRAVKAARRRGLKLKVTALDYDMRIVPLARSAAGQFPEIEVRHGSIFEVDKNEKYDFIFSNHFLHHLSWDDIERVIRFAASASRLGFIFNDLKRSRSAYFFYTVFSSLFMHRSLAFHDGRLSILKGFDKGELNAFLDLKFPMREDRIKIEAGETFPSRIFIRSSTIPTGSL